jgi:hypothetical protein
MNYSKVSRFMNLDYHLADVSVAGSFQWSRSHGFFTMMGGFMLYYLVPDELLDFILSERVDKNQAVEITEDVISKAVLIVYFKRCK